MREMAGGEAGGGKAAVNCGRTLLASALMLAASTATFGGDAGKQTPAPGSTGRLHLTFTERSPLSAPEVVMARLDELRRGVTEANARKSCTYDLADESFDAVVPAGYKPLVPHGLFVWMGVTEAS